MAQCNLTEIGCSTSNASLGSFQLQQNFSTVDFFCVESYFYQNELHTVIWNEKGDYYFKTAFPIYPVFSGLTYYSDGDKKTYIAILFVLALFAAMLDVRMFFSYRRVRNNLLGDQAIPH